MLTQRRLEIEISQWLASWGFAITINDKKRLANTRKIHRKFDIALLIQSNDFLITNTLIYWQFMRINVKVESISTFNRSSWRHSALSAKWKNGRKKKFQSMSLFKTNVQTSHNFIHEGLPTIQTTIWRLETLEFGEFRLPPKAKTGHYNSELSIVSQSMWFKKFLANFNCLSNKSIKSSAFA